MSRKAAVVRDEVERGRERQRMLRSTREHNLMFMEHTTTTCMYGRRSSHESGT